MFSKNKVQYMAFKYLYAIWHDCHHTNPEQTSLQLFVFYFAVPVIRCRWKSKMLLKAQYTWYKKFLVEMLKTNPQKWNFACAYSGLDVFSRWICEHNLMQRREDEDEVCKLMICTSPGTNLCTNDLYHVGEILSLVPEAFAKCAHECLFEICIKADK